MATVVPLVCYCPRHVLFAWIQDFLQVLSIFAALKFEWPPMLVKIYNAISITAFNLDILAPECR